MEYGVQISGIGGWGAELNREIVSCRACVRAVCMSSEFGPKIYGRLLTLFPFSVAMFSLFPSREAVFSWYPSRNETKSMQTE